MESAGAAAREAEATEAAEKHASRGRSTAPLSADGANPMARKRPDADAHPAEAEEEADATVRNVETRLPTILLTTFHANPSHRYLTRPPRSTSHRRSGRIPRTQVFKQTQRRTGTMKLRLRAKTR